MSAYMILVEKDFMFVVKLEKTPTILAFGRTNYQMMQLGTLARGNWISDDS